MSGRRPRLSEESKELITKLFNEGQSAASLAVQFSVSRTTITRIVKPEYGMRQKEVSKQNYLMNREKITAHKQERSRKYTLLCHREEEASLVAHLESKENRTEYFRFLIQKDMAGEIIWDGTEDLSRKRRKVNNTSASTESGRSAYRQFALLYHKEYDKELVAFLDSKKNLGEYLRTLVRKDLSGEVQGT